MQLPGELTGRRGDQRPGDRDRLFPCTRGATISSQAFRRLHAYLTTTFPLSFRITIADKRQHGSHVGPIACALEVDLPHWACHLPQQEGSRSRPPYGVAGQHRRSRVLHGRRSVDRSVRVASPCRNRCSRATAMSPSAPGLRARRASFAEPKREVISRCYNVLLRTTLATQFSDAAMRIQGDAEPTEHGETATHVQDNRWFFDTNCSCSPSGRACGFTRCRSIGSTNPDSRVDIVQTAIADLRGNRPA